MDAVQSSQESDSSDVITERLTRHFDAHPGRKYLLVAEPIAIVNSDALGIPLNGDRNLLNFKALIAGRVLEGRWGNKVGIVGSQSAAGRTAQSLVSYAIPGDMGSIRNPVRSTVYGAITPGGGGGGRRRGRRGGLGGLGLRLGRDRIGGGALRCPTGFENGGRFATRGFGNCGRRLFDGAVGGSGSSSSGNVAGLVRREGRRLKPGKYETSNVQDGDPIPRIAAADNERFTAGIANAVTALADPKAEGLLLVRRDGRTLRAAVSANVLSGVKGNPDMQDGALVSKVKEPNSMGEQEVPTLWKSGIRKVTFTLPGGGSISVARNRELDAADRRKLARVWAGATNQSDGEYDYGLRLRRLAEGSNGSLGYEESFPNINNPQETVTVAEIGNGENTVSVQRWVLETYLADKAPGRSTSTKKKWKAIDVDSTASSVSDGTINNATAAAAHLKANGNPADVPAELLNGALKASKAFKSTTVRPGVTLLERTDGQRWYRIDGDDRFGHLSERISSDVLGALGLEMPPVKFIGEGSNRDTLVAHPENAGGKMNRSTVANMDPKDLLRVVVGDWLTDQRDRNPSSILTIGNGRSARLVPTSNRGGALAGLSVDELEARRRLTLKDFLDQSLNDQAAKNFSDLAMAQRAILIDLYDDLLKRASNFNWDDYTSRLTLDGQISPGEKAHLELVKRLFERRLKNLRSSRQRFFTGMEIS